MIKRNILVIIFPLLLLLLFAFLDNCLHREAVSREYRNIELVEIDTVPLDLPVLNIDGMQVNPLYYLLVYRGKARNEYF